MKHMLSWKVAVAPFLNLGIFMLNWINEKA